jgi:hypothetical protein
MAKLFQFDTTNKVKILKGPVIVSEGTDSAGEPVGLNANGKLDTTVLPSEIGIAVITYKADGALSANDLVNIYYAGTEEGWLARKASSDSADTYAVGFVKEAASDGESVPVYLDGTLTIDTATANSLTSNKLFLGENGKIGNYDEDALIYQVVGYRVGASVAEFEPGEVIIQPDNAS